MAEKTGKAVLISLKPEWWELIRSGKKTLEIRRTRPADVKLPARVIVYATAPVSVVIGEFLCGNIIRNTKSNFHNLTRRSLVSLEDLEQYADGHDLFAWTVYDPVQYDRPMLLSDLGVDCPPQSWQYVEVSEFWPD